MIEAWVEHAPGHDEWYLGARGAVPNGMTAVRLPTTWPTPEQAVASDDVDKALAEWGYERRGDPWRDHAGRWWISTAALTREPGA